MRSACWLVLAFCACVAALGSTALAQQGGWFGAEVVDVTRAEADKLGWDAPHGAKVSRIEPGSPAEKAKLKVGAIIVVLDET
jgi:S1-C subfamily serine protease